MTSDELPVSGDAFAGVQLAGDDSVVPFQVDALDVRGRAVQLGPMLNSILERHQYPPAVSALLAEVTTLTVLLGTSLKFDGKFIVQTQTDGPVSLLVVDFTTPDAVRAYARYDEAKLANAVTAGAVKSEELMGKGILAMTIDQGQHMQRYQGVVQLDGVSLEEVARQYFRQSEQIPTEVRLAAAEIMTPNEDNGGFEHSWRGGGIIVQFLPDMPDRMRMPDLSGGDVPEGHDDHEFTEDDAWAEAKALIGTIADDELIDPQISAERLLYRLFHENGVAVYESTKVLDKCSCSRERIVELVSGIDRSELNEALEDGEIVTNCEFCSTEYRISPSELD